MGISPYPASVLLPTLSEPYPTILEFLCGKFPRVPAGTWEERLALGKIQDGDGNPLGPGTAYRPGLRVFYFREVEQEEPIPFEERILFRNDEILVACKPHFLPVTPGGRFVEQSLVNRLRKTTGLHDLVPLHRIDRETAGLVLFSVNPETRTRYYELFKTGAMNKEYQALSAAPGAAGAQSWLVADRLEPGEPWFRMARVPGAVNARSQVDLVRVEAGLAHFNLKPLTGKTHQLRVHLAGLGYPILNDRLYPELEPERPDDFARPLQLLARSLAFVDPVSGKRLSFESERRLLW